MINRDHKLTETQSIYVRCRDKAFFPSSDLPSPVWSFAAVHHPPRRKSGTWRRHQHQGFHRASCALPLCPFLPKTHACWPAKNRFVRPKYRSAVTCGTIWPVKSAPWFWFVWVCPWGRLRSLHHWRSSWFVPPAGQGRRWSAAALVWGNQSSEQHLGSSWSTDPAWRRWAWRLNMTPAGSINLSQKYFPNLVDGTGDKTLDIFSTSKNLWERVTEGRCCLDGWEADLSWNDSKHKKRWRAKIFHLVSQNTANNLQAFFFFWLVLTYQCSRCL